MFLEGKDGRYIRIMTLLFVYRVFIDKQIVEIVNKEKIKHKNSP